MSEAMTKNSEYERLTPQRKLLIDKVLENLAKGDGLWTQGWKASGIPESGITGKQYRGVNNFFLTLVAMSEGYSDNRWVTFRQMEERDWHFKTDEEGKSLGKGKGATIEFFELRDKETGKPFDKHTLDGMTQDEKDDYFKDNVRPIRKYYRVFNADIIDGITEREKSVVDETAKSERAEKIIDYWDKNEAKIVYGGSQAYYRPLLDEIHLPKKEDFTDMPEFYVTALHEIGHSTGHEKRLNRDLKNTFGSPEYALEELRAEIASMFMEQDLEISVSENHIQNNAAYIQNWHDKIEENPNELFTAIADADKIAKYVMSKEKQKKTEYFAIQTDQNEYGDTVYRVYMTSEHGQTALAINHAFNSREALMQEFEKIQKYPAWGDSEFQEVGFNELQQKSLERAEESEVKQEQSEVYIKPSVVAAMGVAARKPIDMTGRGIESLTKMSDRDVVDKAAKTKNGDKFTELYNGGSILGSEEKDERSLMSRIAMFCNGDVGQLLRIFRSSGQFRDGKPNAFYERMAGESMKFVERIRNENKAPMPNTSGSNKRFGNAKT